MKNLKKLSKSALAAATVTALSAGPAMAQIAQPDTGDATAYITAGAVTLLGVLTVKYGPAAAVFIGKWVKRLIGG